ncbi:uncharacterized protein LOC117639171 [Thrips palmi]|uniref:Uncharacterized protein LOC117639171 n=1 Tax=Thrips palmi TaxID=161013 RepID=A0A6P8ZGP6_THRPL|nr:uncharacterized protein LOC117639171 [Thrips palmi]
MLAVFHHGIYWFICHACNGIELLLLFAYHSYFELLATARDQLLYIFVLAVFHHITWPPGKSDAAFVRLPLSSLLDASDKLLYVSMLAVFHHGIYWFICHACNGIELLLLFAYHSYFKLLATARDQLLYIFVLAVFHHITRPPGMFVMCSFCSFTTPTSSCF